MKKFMDLIKREDGVTAPEYALIAALVAVVLIVGATAMGEQILAKFNLIADEIAGAGAAG